MRVLSRAAGVLVVVATAVPSVRSQPPTLVLSHVNVVDVERGAIKSDVTVTIAKGRIATVAAGESRPPAGAQIIDAKGKYLIPGLWDMHVHWYEERLLPLFIANGVLGVRQMFGAPLHLSWRDRINRGVLLGPRQVVGSPIVDGPNPVWPGSLVVATAEEGRAVVGRIKREGYDFVKVYNRLPRAAYLAIVDEAKRSGLTVEGHVPAAVGVFEATTAGQKTIDHLSGVLIGTSAPDGDSGGAGSRVQLLARPGSDLDETTRAVLRTERDRMLRTFDVTRASALIKAFLKHGTWHCPTLVVLRANARLDDPTFRNDPRLKYLPRTIRDGWTAESSPGRGWMTAADYEVDRRMLRLQMKLVVAMQQAGVNLLAGTDVLNPLVFPGFSLHDELALLVGAGLTPAEAIRTATINPARYLRKQATQGTVQAGRVADLVLLDGNPLEDIMMTTKIVAVIFGGRLFDRTAIGGMLQDAEALSRTESGR